MNYLKQVSLIVSLAVAGASYTLFLHPVNAQKSDLTSGQISSLQSLGIKIAVPSYIPPGFFVSEVKVEPCPPEAKRTAQNTCRFGPQYEIIYRNADNICFAILATGGGLGGPEYEYSFPVETALFGEVYIKFGEYSGEAKKPSEQQLKSPQNNLFMDWVGEGPFYSLQEGRTHSVSECQNGITPAEVTKIVQSLQWLD